MACGTASSPKRENTRTWLRPIRKTSIYRFRTAALVAAFLLATNVFSERASINVSPSFVDSCWPGVTWDELGIRHENAIRAQPNRAR
jgi:hypothetical protein